eukprot:gene33974-43919_t
MSSWQSTAQGLKEASGVTRRSMVPTGIVQRLMCVQGGQYLGEQTRQVQVQLVTYSATSGIFAYIQMNALREKGGYYRLETEVTGLSESWWLALERPSSAAVLVVWVAAVLVWFRRDLLHFFQFSRDATLVTALHLLLTSKAALTTWQ